jgi:hypothetical protein
MVHVRKELRSQCMLTEAGDWPIFISTLNTVVEKSTSVLEVGAILRYMIMSGATAQRKMLRHWVGGKLGWLDMRK